MRESNKHKFEKFVLEVADATCQTTFLAKVHYLMGNAYDRLVLAQSVNDECGVEAVQDVIKSCSEILDSDMKKPDMEEFIDDVWLKAVVVDMLTSS